MTPAPLQLGQAPSELALNSAGFTPLAFANALRIGSSSPVYVAGLLRREPRIVPWSIETTPAPAGIDPCTSELLPEPATPVTTTSTPSGMSTSTSRRLFAVAPRISSVPVGVRTVSLRAARSSRLRPVMVPLACSALDGALEADAAARRTGAGAEGDDVVGDRDRLRLVLDDGLGVALCRAGAAAGRSSAGCHAGGGRRWARRRRR